MRPRSRHYPATAGGAYVVPSVYGGNGASYGAQPAYGYGYQAAAAPAPALTLAELALGIRAKYAAE